MRTHQIKSTTPVRTVLFSKKPARIKVAANDNNEKIRKVMSLITDLIVFSDPFGNLVEIAETNPDREFRIPQLLPGKTIRDIFPSPYAESIMDAIQEASTGNLPMKIEFEIIQAEKKVWFDIKMVSVSPGLIVLLARNVSDLKQTAQELKYARNKAEEYKKYRMEFLQNISHEIRTPLNAIVGFSSLIGEPGQSDETRKSFAEIIATSSDQITLTINDLTEISNIDSGSLIIRSTIIDLNANLGKLRKSFSCTASGKGIGIRIVASLPDNEAIIISDSAKLMKVISNLVSNAVKFSDKGLVDIGYSLNNGFLEFFVSDSGTGIKEEDKDRIFEPFYKINKPDLQQYNGAGLGLAISKAYVELLGGRIWFRSEENKGSDFYFTIPYHKA